MGLSQPLPDDDAPMTLDDACRLLFNNAIRPTTLKAEAGRGNLVIERIGRRFFVTRSAIREMRKKCQVAPPQKDQGSGSSLPASGLTGVSPRPAGASETTDDTSVALSSALLSVERLNKLSQSTSHESTRSRRASLSLVKG